MIAKYWHGIVIRKINAGTIKISTSTTLLHAKYKKVIRVLKRFLVDIDTESYNKLLIGDKIIVQECQKVSKCKSKRFVRWEDNYDR